MTENLNKQISPDCGYADVADKAILDACCGSRMFWFNKQNPLVLYADKRTESHTLCDGRHLEIRPDIEADFTEMPFPDNHFKLVVFDPPHLVKLGKGSWMAKKYGVLPVDWRAELKKGFDECMRVLQPHGILIFKWNENQIKVVEIRKIIKVEPLFGHVTGRHQSTHWMTFMKLPES